MEKKHSYSGVAQRQLYYKFPFHHNLLARHLPACGHMDCSSHFEKKNSALLHPRSILDIMYIQLISLYS